jgi:hypothetical protein
VTILNKQSQTDGWCGPLAWRLGGGLRIPHHKNCHVTKCFTGYLTWMDSLTQDRDQ